MENIKTICKDLRRSICIVVIYNNKFLCIKRSENKSFPGSWTYIGGKVEESDDSIYQAAIRELWEETGIQVHDINDLQLSEYVYDDIKNGFSVEFCILNLSKEPVIKLSDEASDYFFCPIELGLNILTEEFVETRKFFKYHFKI